MAKQKEYYEILGVGRNADTDEIKKAYRRLARKFHPDLHPGDKSNEARFKEINEAYGVLGDPEKRRRYDLGGRVTFEGAPFGGAGGLGFDFTDFGANLGGVEDIFGEIFGARGGRGPRVRQNVPARGEDTVYSLDIDFLHAVKGTDVRVSVRKGEGTEKITVKIPPGVSDGSRVRVAGRGGPGLFGGPPGDLYIITRVKPHPYFTRVGNDIYLDVPVTVTEALLGAKVEVPTLDGFSTVKIPPGTGGGRKLRLKGKGIKRGKGIRRGERGCQYIVIKIAVPGTLDGKSKKLVEEFAEINPYEPRRGLW
jgi:DnaJ-class molecular chaperone